MGTAPAAHLPVMVDSVVDLFRPVPPGLIVDATVGGGGHARAVLDALPRHRLLGLDRDEEALAAAHVTLTGFGDRVVLRHARFDRLNDMVQETGAGPVTGVLFAVTAVISFCMSLRPLRTFAS